jgi:hypothetical protein
MTDQQTSTERAEIERRLADLERMKRLLDEFLRRAMPPTRATIH